MVRGALATVLGLEPDIEVVGQVRSGDEVLAAARASRPDGARHDRWRDPRGGAPARRGERWAVRSAVRRTAMMAGMGKLAVRWLRRTAFGAVLFVVLVGGGTAFRVWQVARVDDRSRADVIVV